MAERILIIDDDDRTRKLFRKILEREAYEVLEAANGKEGINLYRRESADLVITDIIMPEKEGIETIMELRREFPDVKIMAMSGGGHVDAESYLDVAKKMGAAETLTKPASPEELLKTISKIFEQN